MSDISLFAKFKNFYAGASPIATFDSFTEMGNAGNYSSALNVDILTPTVLQAGPSLVNLTGGTEAGAVNELINYISDIAIATDTTYGISTTKLHKITPTEVINTSPFPHSITSAVCGKSVVYLRGALYYFYTRASDGAIGAYDLSASFTDDWKTGLTKANLMPVATKEDILLFGHGRYVGVYFASTATMNLTRLDFGTNEEVSDICFHANQWLIAVNGGVGGRTCGQIFLYGGDATTASLIDEASVGIQKIGFLFPHNGIIYVAYQDLSSTNGYKIGYLNGRELVPLVSFTGTLPTYAQKTLYKNTILFLSAGLVYSAGAVIGELPFAISQLTTGGYATTGAIATPFGTTMIASTNGTNCRLAQFSTIPTTANWRSVIVSTQNGKLNGYIDYVTVRTRPLGATAIATLKLETNQGTVVTPAYTITGTGLRKFTFNINRSDVDDFRILLEWSGSVACPIKEVTVMGHFKDA